MSPAEAAGWYKEDTIAALADVHFLFQPSCFSFSPFSQAGCFLSISIGPADAVKKHPTPAFYTFSLIVSRSFPHILLKLHLHPVPITCLACLVLFFCVRHGLEVHLLGQALNLRPSCLGFFSAGITDGALCS